MTYQLCNLNGVLDSIVLIKENQRTSIPICEDNTDYQQYLAWVAEGNQPEAADAALPAEDETPE